MDEPSCCMVKLCIEVFPPCSWLFSAFSCHLPDRFGLVVWALASTGTSPRTLSKTILVKPMDVLLGGLTILLCESECNGGAAFMREGGLRPVERKRVCQRWNSRFCQAACRHAERSQGGTAWPRALLR